MPADGGTLLFSGQTYSGYSAVIMKSAFGKESFGPAISSCDTSTERSASKINLHA